MSTATMQPAAEFVAENGVGWSRRGIAHRAAVDIEPGSYVNLGMGMPLLVADYIPQEAEVFLHSENGILGLGPGADEAQRDPDLVDAGKGWATLRSGAATFDSSMSFCIVRGGRLSLAILGGMQVGVNRNLANWTAPGRTPGVGGAMDLVAGCKATWVLQAHRGKDGSPKLMRECTLPLTGRGVVDRVFTDLGVFEPLGEAFRVVELAPGVSRELAADATDAPLIWKEAE